MMPSMIVLFQFVLKALQMFVDAVLLFLSATDLLGSPNKKQGVLGCGKCWLASFILSAKICMLG